MSLPGFTAEVSLSEVVMSAISSDFGLFLECPEKLGCTLIEQSGWVCKYVCLTVKYGGIIE